jgi:hypothetical protein
MTSRLIIELKADGGLTTAAQCVPSVLALTTTRDA